jgi:ribonuclease HII
MAAAMNVPPRRSARLAATAAATNGENVVSNKRIRALSTAVPLKRPKSTSVVAHLPRTRESEILENTAATTVIGIDEAGRGPLAGPVVAAAAWVPTNVPGISDSKALTEAQREALFEQIVASPGVAWAAAVIDAARIDEINILQATLEAMRTALLALVESSDNENQAVTTTVQTTKRPKKAKPPPPPMDIPICTDFSAHYVGSYVVTHCASKWPAAQAHAIIDGNRLPPQLPCAAETMVQGDSKEYCVAAASILAKVVRDRLMHEHHQQYPLYNLAQHKGYPTAAHMSVIRQHGATPIHRKTFAPLKHMNFLPDGRIAE